MCWNDELDFCVNLFQKINFVVVCELCIYNASFKRSIDHLLRLFEFGLFWKGLGSANMNCQTMCENNQFLKCKRYKDLSFELFLHFLTQKIGKKWPYLFRWINRHTAIQIGSQTTVISDKVLFCPL